MTYRILHAAARSTTIHHRMKVFEMKLMVIMGIVHLVALVIQANNFWGGHP